MTETPYRNPTPTPAGPPGRPGPDAPPGPEPAQLELDQLLLHLLLGGLVSSLVMFGAQSGRLPAWLGAHALDLWLPLWVLAGLVFGGPLLADRSSWLKRGLRFTRSQFVDYGGGFYGAVGLICFLQLEAVRVAEEWAALALDPSRHAVWNRLFDFGIDSMMNGIYAFAWPGFIGRALDGEQVWPAVAIGYGVFESSRYLIRQWPRRAMR